MGQKKEFAQIPALVERSVAHVGEGLGANYRTQGGRWPRTAHWMKHPSRLLLGWISDEKIGLWLRTWRDGNGNDTSDLVDPVGEINTGGLGARAAL